MRTNFLLAMLLIVASALLVEMTLVNKDSKPLTKVMAQVTGTTRTPTPTTITLSRFLYITYQCSQDRSGDTYVLANLNKCRSSSDWYKAADTSCANKTGGTIINYTLSPGCVSRQLPTPTLARPTPTPTRGF